MAVRPALTSYHTPSNRGFKFIGKAQMGVVWPLLGSAGPTEFLVRSGVLQILFTTILGWAMLLPHQAWGPSSSLATRLRSRDVAMAHVDWIMLALVQFAAAYILTLKAVPSAHVVARCLAFYGWVGPSVYMARAWGINGFRLDGKRMWDTVMGTLGFTGILAFTYGWAQIVGVWWM